MHIQHKLSIELNKFSKWIKVSEDDIAKGRQLGHYICNLIEKYGEFKTDRILFGGSFGKGTSTFLKVDVDITIFVNWPEEMKLEFRRDECLLEILGWVKQDWKKVLMEHTHLSEKDFRGRNAVKFTLQNFQFDLCPGINVSRDSRQQAIKFRQIYQFPVDISKMGVPHTTAISYSKSESSFEFVMKQSEYVKDLCRLTKFWQQGIPCIEYKSGRSFLFEVIAIR